MKTTLDRRSFLKASLTTSGGLLLALNLEGCTTTDLRSLGSDSFVPNAYLEITPQGQILFTLDRVEMGQGTYTGLTTLIAEELEVEPESISVNFAPAAKAYNNREYNLQMTGGSNSMRSSYLPLRILAASTKEMLMHAAAQTWQVDVTLVGAEDGHCINLQTRKRIPYGMLTALAARQNVVKNPVLKTQDQFKYIGKHNKRLDAEAKVFGRANYGMDTRLEGMVYAVAKRPPVYGSELISFNAGTARSQPGVIDVFQWNNLVVVVAERYWQAHKAANLVEVKWHAGKLATVSYQDILDDYRALAEQEQGAGVSHEENFEKALADSANSIAADYHFPYLAHVPMEPMNCTAWVTKNRCEVWASTQAPDIAKLAAANVSGLDMDQVRIHTTFLGGGFGRRLSADYVKEAVAVSKQIQRPVKLIWSREDDIKSGLFRPVTYHKLQATVDGTGSVTGWQHKLVAPRIMTWFGKDAAPAILPVGMQKALSGFVGDFAAARYRNYHSIYESLLMLPVDSSPTEGADDLPYEFDHVSVQHVYAESPFPITFWRSVGHSQNAFATECFVDECAHASNIDPFVFRRTLLQRHPRHLQVLERVAQMCDWHRPPEGRFFGIACHKSFHSYVAQVVEISMDGDKASIHKIYCAVDCGLAVNPEIIIMQMESGIVFGLTAALYGKISHRDGAVEQSNFHDYKILRHDETPELIIEIIDSEAPPSGVGEPGLPPVAPALANAMFAATGKRIRHLPLTSS